MSDLSPEQIAHNKLAVTSRIAAAGRIVPVKTPEVGGYKRRFSYSYETMPDGTIAQTATEIDL